MRQWLVALAALAWAGSDRPASAQGSTAQDINTQNTDDTPAPAPAPDEGRNPQVDPKGPIPLGEPAGGGVDSNAVTIDTPILETIGTPIYTPQRFR